MVKYSGMRKRCSMTFKESNCIRPKYEEAGFTLSELLIVVAIIAVLVAISIPIFTSQLEKSREAADAANIRAAYAELMVMVTEGERNNVGGGPYVSFDIQQKVEGWQNESVKEGLMTLFKDIFDPFYNLSYELDYVTKQQRKTIQLITYLREQAIINGKFSELVAIK